MKERVSMGEGGRDGGFGLVLWCFGTVLDSSWENCLDFFLGWREPVDLDFQDVLGEGEVVD